MTIHLLSTLTLFESTCWNSEWNFLIVLQAKFHWSLLRVGCFNIISKMEIVSAFCSIYWILNFEVSWDIGLSTWSCSFDGLGGKCCVNRVFGGMYKITQKWLELCCESMFVCDVSSIVWFEEKPSMRVKCV